MPLGTRGEVGEGVTDSKSWGERQEEPDLRRRASWVSRLISTAVWGGEGKTPPGAESGGTRG